MTTTVVFCHAVPMSLRNATRPSASWPSRRSSAPPASALIGVRVPAAELHGRDVGSAAPAEGSCAAACMSGVMPPRRALPRAIGSSPTSSCCCSAASKRLCSAASAAVQHRQPLEKRVVHRAELRRRPRFHLIGPGQRQRHAGRDRDAAALARHDLQQPVQPAIDGTGRPIEARLEDRLAVEVAARAMRDRHRVDHGELVGVPERAQWRQPWRQAERVVERRQIGCVVGERSAQRAVGRVAVRHDARRGRRSRRAAG